MESKETYKIRETGGRYALMDITTADKIEEVEEYIAMVVDKYKGVSMDCDLTWDVQARFDRFDCEQLRFQGMKDGKRFAVLPVLLFPTELHSKVVAALP